MLCSGGESVDKSMPFEDLQNELKEIQEMYLSLLREFEQSGDINLFAEFDERLTSLKEQVMRLPISDERHELLGGVTALSKKYNSLLHSA